MNRGMTLAELILAMFLLLILIVSVLGLFTALLGSSVKSNNQEVGIMFAERVLDEYSKRAKPDFPAFEPTVTGREAFYTQDEQNQTQFIYSVTAQPVDAAKDTPGETWLLEAEVRWWANTTTSRTGQGNLYVRQGRLVYVSR